VPITHEFADRILPILEEIIAAYGTPFHIYDARGIIESHRSVVTAFAGEPFRQHFAVKALPNPAVLSLLLSEGSGFDCASPVELELVQRIGATGDDVVFTSNNTSLDEYQQALAAGALMTFDDRVFFARVNTLPETVSFRVSPHGLAAGCTMMGDASHTKFGVPPHELALAYREARRRGAAHFGLHGMICANELNADRAIRAALDVIELAAEVATASDIDFDYIDLGGGIGIPYRPEDKPFNFNVYADAIINARNRCFPESKPLIRMECGRYVTGPHGVLVTRVINRSRKAREIVGVDASMSALMRPGLYGAYHHVTLPFASGRAEACVDVVGSLCENIDKFAIDRLLPDPAVGDIALIHDTGAHGHAMGFTYNGRLRPAELLLTLDGDVAEIRRAETFDDYLATARWRPCLVLRPARKDTQSECFGHQDGDRGRIHAAIATVRARVRRAKSPC
jgi:diaminopimelate decarboxylase